MKPSPAAAVKRDHPTGWRFAAAAVVVLVAGAVWLTLAPASLGGQFRPLTIRGASMEPAYRAGDLVFVRRHATYAVGDVVAYRSESVRATFLHRIVAVDDAGRFTMKGDANDFLDPDQAGTADILGVAAFRIPHVGRIAVTNQTSAVIGALVALLMFGRMRRSRNGEQRRLRASTASPSLPQSTTRIAGAVALGGSLLLVVAIPGLLTARPSEVPEQVEYEHRGVFSYRSDAPRAIYPAGLARTGEAVFLEVSRTVTVGFRYELWTQHDADLRGKIAFDAHISDGYGWSRTIPVASESVFSGTDARVQGAISLSKLREVTDRLERMTGITRSVYRVELQPRVSIQGGIGSAHITNAFEPALPLEMDRAVLRYVPTDDAERDPLKPSAAVIATGAATQQPATVQVLGRSMPSRTAGIALMPLAFLLGLVAWSLLRRDELAAADDSGILRRRFADRIVEIDTAPDGPTMSVSNRQGFERLVDACELPVFEHVGARGTSWVLRDGGVTYAFHVPAAEPLAVVEERASLKRSSA